MNEQLDSRKMFLKQIASHSAALVELIGCETKNAAPAAIMEKCILGTHMLAGTSSLMEYSAWENVLKAYEDLLVRYKDLALAWDDRIAQVTSELIIKEDTLVKNCEVNAALGIEDSVAIDELIALREEIVVYIESAGVASDAAPADTVAESAPPEPNTDEPSPPAESANDIDIAPTAPMRGVVGELKNTYAELVKGIHSEAFAARDWASREVTDIHDQLHLLEFYIRSIEQTMRRHGSPATRQTSDLAPLKTALTDFANDVSGADVHALDIVLADNDVEIDPRLLAVAGEIIHCMITDVFNRSESSAIGISIEVEEKHGALHWRFSDSGDHYMSDSEVDHEDHLAFYPGLKEIGRILGRYNGVLWVEPDDEHITRFEFTLPATTAVEAFIIWGEGVGTFGVRTVQLCDLMPVDSVQRGNDLFGEFLTINDKRIPLFRLNMLFDDAPSGGEMIAVLGSLGKRIAFYVPGAGSPVEGKVLENGIPIWRGSPHRIAEANGQRIVLLDADQLLGEYLERTSELEGEETGVAGGSGAKSAAAKLNDRKSPSAEEDHDGSLEHKSPAEENENADVLVVEQSESLRGVFADIFGHHQIKAVYAANVDDAVGLIHSYEPRVIVSEFRMPTMAAKTLVEVLADEDLSTPVLVTTSQSGKTADLLVEKLKVSGFLSKPLDRGEVFSRIGSYLEEKVQT